MVIAIIVAVLCLAYANGANDNFKGVATLFGSGTTDYRRALLWATVTTFFGSLTAVFLAGTLLTNFSGKGLVDDSLVASLDYGAAVGLGAGLTVLLATKTGMPISTTHALVGALTGAGWAAGSTINLGKLGGSFFLPLLMSPLVSLVSTVVCYRVFCVGRRLFRSNEKRCYCVGIETAEVVSTLQSVAALRRVEQWKAATGTSAECDLRYEGRLLRIDAATVLDKLHWLSGGIVSFARGLNDTPKIAALLLITPALGHFGSTSVVAVAIAIGGLISARKVAETMSQKITPMNHIQGFTANLISGIIVIGASRLGLPVSTTHVSCGSLFGIGTLTGEARLRMIGKILLAWLTTLPLGAVSGGIAYLVISFV